MYKGKNYSTTKPCKCQPCDRPVFCRGYCSTHYQRLMDGTDMGRPLRPNIKGGVPSKCEYCHKDYVTRAKGGGNPQRYCSKFCYERAYYKENVDEIRDKLYKKTYGITFHEYLLMLHKQGVKCAICRKLPRHGRRLDVDHNHKTKKVRGLLCGPCNRHVGYFEAHGAAILKYLATRG